MRPPEEFDYVVIGSGFGGSVSALRLAEKGYRVAVLEQGRRWTPESLPTSNWDTARWIHRPALGLRGFFNMRFFRHVVVLHGNAVGGGSITYGNTLLVPPNRVWNEGTWAGLADWQAEMPAHYARAQHMLGVTTNRRLGHADHLLKRMAKEVGAEGTFYPTEVGIFFGDDGRAPGATYPDPYFQGEGPARKSCIACGGCMVGCRHDAKNTLDKNYLYLAERKGAQVFAETKVVDVRPVGATDGEGRGAEHRQHGGVGAAGAAGAGAVSAGGEDGAAGYVIDTVSTVPGDKASRRTLRAKGVVFAASSLGTQELLFRLREQGSLPRISQALGQRVRTNAESLIAVRFPGSTRDLSEGIAIGSGIYIDEHTHIEAVRYPKGSDAMALLTTVMTLGRPGWTRIFTWMATLLHQLFTQPIMTLKTLSPFKSAQETVIFLCMQTLEGHLTMRWRRRWYWPFSKTLTTQGDRIPTFIAAANEFAVKAARATGGVPQTTLTEILLNVPMTAHCMGGAAMGRTAEEGVCDRHNRVFGYRNMYIVDGSMLAANLGVNPSLTITALAERAMAYIPPARVSEPQVSMETTPS
ncbi:GMC family oxidoreductase [Roseateles sp. SL47]|uniref:GMC family oxidoreductase n=1 Tax=Roseateles sp. SL47 TaxID=2995138 RepID=UPI002270D162|nr:GMC family oxidoreductase [Roseateles sp. SL47]WAC75649.1 GMC family oxidoreductase [Roseateles sp. SL47]